MPPTIMNVPRVISATSVESSEPTVEELLLENEVLRDDLQYFKLREVYLGSLVRQAREELLRVEKELEEALKPRA